MPAPLQSKGLQQPKWHLKMAKKTQMMSSQGDEPSNVLVMCANIVEKTVTGRRNVKNYTIIAKDLTVSCEGIMLTSMHGPVPS